MVEQLTRTTPVSSLRTLGDALRKTVEKTRFVAQNAMVLAEWTLHEVRGESPQSAVSPRTRTPQGPAE
ncbi:MAG TPA: hypothetical protein VN711_01545 [Candidatus Saccharimonadales bacterium]|nr:hypothetical protein [Candidatus Saccharimonadales bacterium]